MYRMFRSFCMSPLQSTKRAGFLSPDPSRDRGGKNEGVIGLVQPRQISSTASALSMVLFVSSVFGIISVAAVSGAQDAPSPRQAHAMAYDAESDRIVLFGGDLEARIVDTSSVVIPVGDTWSFDLNLSPWTNMNPAEAPSPRQGTAMAYDAESDRVVLFGGSRPELSDQTWVYDFNTNTWREMNPATSPSPRVSVPGAMVYDAESDRVVLFGDLVGVLDDETWTYDFNSTRG